MSGPSAEGPAPAPSGAAEAGLPTVYDLAAEVMTPEPGRSMDDVERWRVRMNQQAAAEAETVLGKETRRPTTQELVAWLNHPARGVGWDAFSAAVAEHREPAQCYGAAYNALAPHVATLVAAAEERGNDERAELYRSIGEMEAKHRAACASWERRLREQTAAAAERGAAAERERIARECLVRVRECEERANRPGADRGLAKRAGGMMQGLEDAAAIALGYADAIEGSAELRALDS